MLLLQKVAFEPPSALRLFFWVVILTRTFQESDADPNIVFANVDSIRYIDIANFSDQGILIGDLNDVKALAVYVKEGWLFWSEFTSAATTISRSRLTDVSVKEVILRDLGDVHDMAVEWETGLLYWTDYMHETVEVATLNGSLRKTLIWENIANPSAIVVDSRHGYMFWSERGWDHPQIERTTLAGTDRTVLVNTFSPAYLPQLLINSLVIDFNSDLLYWVDAYTSVIEQMKLNGTDRRPLNLYSSRILNSYSLTLYRDMLYASDLSSRSIERIDITTEQLYRNMGWITAQRIYGIALNDSSREPSGMSACKGNRDCSHFCLLTPSGGICACSNGYELSSDNRACQAAAPTTDPPVQAIEIRLMDGATQSVLKGRLEVRQPGGDWGTVCDDQFDLRGANVVCRMLNHTSAESYFRPYDEYGFLVSDSVDIWLDNLKCRGTENSLMECKHRGWGISNCGHIEDVGIICKNDSIPTPTAATPTVGPPTNISVRLRAGSAENNGRVEVFYNGTWGTICDNDWDILDAHVVCRMLGFDGAWSTECCGYYGYESSKEILLDNVQCSGNENSLAECPHGGWGGHDDVCTHFNDVGVFCIPKPVEYPGTIIRLADGPNPNEGRVELFYVRKEAGEDVAAWGTICQDRWDLKDAAVICRMLNFSGVLAAPKYGAYGPGSGKIWFDGLECVGDESNITDCPHDGLGVHDCSHFDDAGVICQSNDSALPSYDARRGLVFGDFTRHILFQVDLDAFPLRAAPLPIDEIRGAGPVAFDPIDGRIYYAEFFPGVIRRSFLNGSSEEMIINGVYYANWIEIDYIYRNVYFVDYGRDRIDVAALNGLHRTMLISRSTLEGIALDLINGHIYWASNGYPPRIERADMDGKNQTVILELTSSSYISGLTLEHLASGQIRLYYSEVIASEVYYIEIAANGSVPFITSQLNYPIDLTTLGSKLYLTDIGGAGTWDSGIYSAVLGDPDNVSQVIDLIGAVWGIDAYDRDATGPSDTRECPQNCSHLCLNAPSGPHCACPADMELNNETTCSYRRLVLHTECYFSEIYKSPLIADDLLVFASSIALEHASCPTAVSSSSWDEKIYWTDLRFRHIARANLDGTEEEIILDNVIYSLGLAVDSLGRNIYFTDKTRKTVEVAKLDGSNRKVLIQSNTHEPIGLAIDPSRGYMYFSEWGDPPMIKRAELDGTNEIVLMEFPSSSTEGPSALAVDVDENYLYWVRKDDPSLQYIDLSYPYSEIAYHIEFSHYLFEPTGLALDANHFYWTDALLGNVIRANRTGDHGTVELIPRQFTPGGVNIYDPNDIQDPHSCVETCSHLCLMKPGGYKCACPDENAGNCMESINVTSAFGCPEDPSLYFIDQHSINCIDLKTYNYSFHHVNVKTVKTGFTDTGAIDIDHEKGMIFWSDYAQFTISSMDLVTGETRVLIRDDLGEVDGLACEWESELLYWTDYLFERIEVARMDGSYRKTLFTTNVYNPRGIAVDPKSGYMFWTDWGLTDPKIERAHLTGNNRVNIFPLGYSWFYVFFPMSVVIDYEAERIYWMDAYDNYIDSADLDGQNVDTIHYISENIFPADLALYGDNLYWVDWNSQSIQWFNRTRPLLMQNFGHLSDVLLTGVVVSDESRQPVASQMHSPPCRGATNGGCSHLCLLEPGGYKCACPNGLQLRAEDNMTCEDGPSAPPPPPVPELVIRLRGSSYSHEGRVEVYYQGQWGTICDDHWGFREATVVCRMLNYSAASYAVRYAYFGEGNYSSPIWLDNVKCRGDEQTIAACTHRGWNNHDCSHYEDAGVICFNGSAPPTESPTLAPGPHPELRVRLRDGPTSNQGRVELYLNGTWGTICDDYWGIDEANVICRMLGFSEGAWSTHCCSWYDDYSTPSQIWLDNVHCVGDETSIAQCRHGGWGSHNCYHGEDVGVVCKYTPQSSDQIVRLADGFRPGEGRVEVLHDGYWGTVCDDYWDLNDAQVVCRQLGHRRARVAPRNSLFGIGNGHIWLDDVHCVGNESSIVNCPHNGWNDHNCIHHEDASVICSNLTTENLDASNDFLLACEEGRRVCYMMSLPLQKHLVPSIVPVTLLYSPIGVSYDPIQRQIYWTDEYGYIQRSGLNDSLPQLVLPGLGKPMGIEIDSLGRNIYFAEESQHKIRVKGINSPYIVTLAEVDTPQGIALDSSSGLMYFSSVGPIVTIYKADMDGGNKMALTNFTRTVQTFIDLVLDKPGNRLIFSDQENDLIRYIHLGTLEVRTLFSGNLHGPRGLAFYNNTLFWTAEGDGEFSGTIFMAKATSGSMPEMMIDGFWNPSGIYAFNSSASQAPAQSACYNNGGCSQVCVLNPSGRTCKCEIGMKIGEDGTSCILGDVVFVADSYYQEIVYSPLTSDEILTRNLMLVNVTYPNGIDFDPYNHYIYWTDTYRGEVQRSSVYGGNQTVIRSGVSSPSGLALDVVAGNVYWINAGTLTIEVSNLNGKYSKVLVKDVGQLVSDIALDTTRGVLYWSDHGKIERAHMDGQFRRVVAHLIDSYGLYDAEGLALDVETNRIYFVSYWLSSLLYVDLNLPGLGVPQTLLTDFYLFWVPRDVEVDDQFVYWNEYIFENVYRINKTEFDGNLEIIASGMYSPRGMAIKKGEPEPHSRHPCVDICSHICLIKPGGYTCACPDDNDGSCVESVHVPDEYGCSDEPSMYFIDQNNIKCINMKTYNHTYVNVKTVKTGLADAGAIDIDLRERIIFWSDHAQWTINRMSLDTGEVEVIVDDLGQVDGLAYEWVTRKIYFTDYIYERLEVANADGSYRKTLFYTNMYNPRGIAVDPKSGYMFWTDWGLIDPKIERADLTGENREESFFPLGYSWYYVFTPMSLVIDYEAERIYWMDAYDNYIDTADLNGINVDTIHFIGENIFPADLALYGDNLYWVDWNSQSIQWINKTRPLLMFNFGHLTDGFLTGAVVAHESRQPIEYGSVHACLINNGGCSHLCLLGPNGEFKCACPNGALLLNDQRTCSAVTQPTPPPPVPDIMVRLRGSNSSNEGRVEIYHQGQWGTVCDDHWGFREATVVCRMLNFTGAQYAVRLAYFGQGNASFPIWLDNVKCRGDEESIAACRYRGWDMHDCSHYEDAGVICYNGSIPPTEGPTLAPGPHPELRVRLRDGPTSNQGRVELYLNGTWGTICDDYWGIEEADVICRMLGYSEGAWSTHCCSWYDDWSTPNQIWLDDVHCTGNEESIAECRHGGWGSHNCFHGEDVGVVCKFTPPAAPDQIVRLADGYRPGEGRVEIFHDGYWGTVCDDYWDLNDAQVVCRQLGLGRAHRAPMLSLFGVGNGHIWLDNVHCVGNESSIVNCPHNGWNDHNCIHYEDASVICSNMTAENLSISIDFLLTCEEGRRVCYVMSLPLQQHATPPMLPLELFYSPVGVSYDPFEKLMYWTDTNGNIRKSHLNNSLSQYVLPRPMRQPMGLDIDIVARNIYVAEEGGNKIRVIAINGSDLADLIDVDSPQGIALDSLSGVMYFSSVGVDVKIYKADMDGKNQMVLANFPKTAPTLVDVALYKPGKRLFFSDQYNNLIRYIELETLRVRTFFSGTHHPRFLTVYNHTLFWTADGDGQFSGTIFMANATGGSMPEMMIDGFWNPSGIYAFNSSASEAPSEQSACYNNGGCLSFQICVLKPNGRSCICRIGMKMGPDGTTCIFDDVVFVADSYYQQISYSLLTAEDISIKDLLLENLTYPNGIDFDPYSHYIYWTDSARGEVQRSSVYGVNQTVIRSGVSSPSGLALDVVAGNVYWINEGTLTIEVSNLNGKYSKVLVQNLGQYPSDIALDTKRGLLYWSDHGFIESTHMDGEFRRKVVYLRTESGYEYDAQGLAVDTETNRIYFVTYWLYRLMYVDVNLPGLGIPQTLLTDFFLFWFPRDVEVDDQFVYWNEYIFENVYRINKTEFDGNLEVIANGMYSPRGMVIKKGNPKPHLPHPCLDACSHLCLLKPGGYRCACPDDPSEICQESTHVSNTIGCMDKPSMYFSDQHSIKCVNMQTYNHTYIKVNTVKTGLSDAGAIDIHYEEQMIFWSDHEEWTISRMSLVTGHTEVIIGDYLGQVDGLAVEWKTRKIYWSDYIFERIEVANMDGSYRKTLFTNEVYNPRGIAVDPTSGYMFWTDWGYIDPKLERADLTGENRRVLRNLGAYWYHVYFPMSVVINYETERVYWMDAYDNYIDTTDLNGTRVDTIQFIGENIFPADLALYGDNLYWADWNSQSIQWFNTTQPLLMFNFGHLTDVFLTGAVVAHESRQPIGSMVRTCSIMNGGCSHLCLLAPGGGYKCACPNGASLTDDNRTCTEVSPTSTPPPPVPDLMIRLIGSNFSHEGTVELYYQGQWGTICDDHWGFREATVVCRMLNFTGARYAVRGAYFGEGNSSSNIWLDNVKCRGDEQTISACRHRGWNIHNCFHYEDAGVICDNGSVPTTEGPTLAPGPHPELAVRLRAGPTSNQGRVELFLNGTWGTICDDSWGIQEANVICRMLGYSEGAWSTHCCNWYSTGTPPPTQIWLDDVHCVGDEPSIANCRHGGWGSHNCGHFEDVGVVCKYTPIPAPGQTVRLVDGYRDGEGRVEIFHDGHWGTVCDDSWDLNDAQVVCRQLGYLKAHLATHSSFFGEGNGHIWLDEVNCIGSESSLEDCPHDGWNNHDCEHYEDASAICLNATAEFDTDHFLLACEEGRKACYAIQLPMQMPARPITLPFIPDYSPIAITYDPNGKSVYWTDSFGNLQQFSFVDGRVQVVRRGALKAMGIDIDLAGGNIFIADESQNHIVVQAIGRPYEAVLINVPSPQGIALDTFSGYIYYSSVAGDRVQILRADMDGKNAIVLANYSSTSPTTVDVVLDKPGNRLFFSDSYNDLIQYFDLATMRIHTLLSGNLHHPVGLTMQSNTLYWTATGDGSFSGAIFKAETTNPSNAQMIADGFWYPTGIYAYNSSAALAPETHACENNGDCSQLCLLNPTGRTCMCQAGMEFKEDGVTCVFGDVLFVTDSLHGKILYSPLTPQDISLIPLYIENQTSPADIEVDPFEEGLYWTDSSRGTIERAHLYEKDQEIIHSGVNQAYGLALDLVAGNVYWVNGGNLSIFVSKLDGRYPKVLISNLSSPPNDIVVDTTRGRMCWADHGFLECAHMDGANRREVFSLTLSNNDTITVDGLALDVTINRIYFASSYLAKIMFLDLDAVENGSIQLLVPYEIVVFSTSAVVIDDQFLYWNQQWLQWVLRINKTTYVDQSLEIVADGPYVPRGLAIKKGTPERNTSHPCFVSNGFCTHLCLLKPTGYQCACPDEDDVQPCSTLPVPPTTPSTTTETTTAIDYCKDPNLCKNGAKCLIDNDQLTGFLCECKGYFRGLACEIPIAREPIVIYENANVTEEDDVTLNCTTSKDAPSPKWSRKDGEAVETQSRLLEDDETKLSITSASVRDAGIFICESDYDKIKYIFNVTVKVLVKVEMVIKVLNYQYTPELQNKSSKIFIETAENFTAEMDIVYKNTPGYVRTEVLNFTKGSVKVDFRVIIIIVATDPKNESTITDKKAETGQRIIRKAETGFVERLKVSPDVEIKAPPPDPRDVEIFDLKSDELSVRWIPPEDLKSFNVYEYKVQHRRFQMKDVSTNDIPASEGRDKYSYRIQNLKPETTYMISVAAVNKYGPNFNEETGHRTPKPPLAIWIIILIVLGVIFLIAIITGGIVCFRRRAAERRRRQAEERALEGFGNPREIDSVLRYEEKNVKGLKFSFVNDSYKPSDVNWTEIPYENINLMDELGSGAFGVVYRGEIIREKDDVTPCAVKAVKASASHEEIRDLYNELEIMTNVGYHPNLVNLLGACTKDGNLLVVLEIAENGSLLDFLKKSRNGNENYEGDGIKSGGLAEDMKLRIATDVAKGMAYLASHRCIHRDLAARNVLLGENYVAKVADYGMARDVYESLMYKKETQGKLPVKWMAIESLETYVFTVESDIWSYGVLLWEIESGGLKPYAGMTTQEIMTELKKGYRLEKPSGCSDAMYQVMRDCWNPNPKLRPSFEKLAERLEAMV